MVLYPRPSPQSFQGATKSCVRHRPTGEDNIHCDDTGVGMPHSCGGLHLPHARDCPCATSVLHPLTWLKVSRVRTPLPYKNSDYRACAVRLREANATWSSNSNEQNESTSPINAGWTVFNEAAMVMKDKRVSETTSNQPYRIDVSCPLCGSIDCVRAARQGWKDMFYRSIGEFPWQCRECRQCFYLSRRS